MKLPLAVLIASLLLILLPLYSQEAWRHLTTDDGLSDNKILSIYQAKDGDIWIGTDKGINRYNGIFDEGSLYGSVNSILESPTGEIIVRVVVTEQQSRDGVPFTVTSVKVYLFDGLEWEEPEIFDNFRVPRIMPEFAVESVGKLWVSTWDGLVGFDGQKWQQHDTDVDTDWLVKTSDDRLWTENSKMNVIASFNGQKWTAEFDIDNSLLDDAITSTAFVNSTGQILLGTDKGLFQYDPVLNSITDLKLGLVNVRRIYETTDQSLWVATDKGLFQLADGKWQESITDQTINVIQQTDQGQLWVATSNGLYQFHNGEWIRELTVPVNYFAELTDGILLVGGNDGLRIKPSANETIAMQIELAGEFVGGLFLASDDKLWCRSSAGIHSYDGLRWTNHEVPPEMDWDKGQLHRFPFMSNIYEDGNGIIWFNGSGSSRIASFRDGIVKTHPAFPSGGGYWSWSVLETKDGSILATGGIGAPFIYDGNDEDEWKSLPGYGKDKSDANIPLESSAVFQDNDGSIWFNGYQGIWRLHNGQWLEYRDIESKSVPLGEHFIRGPNGILRATTNRGIYRLNSAGKWVVEWKGSLVRHIHVVASGQLVAVTERGGLLINKGQTWLEHISYGDGRIYQNRFGHGFVEYPAGVYWLATNKGLRRIQGDSWYDLTLTDGLPSNDVHTIELDNSGNLWVGTNEGVTHFKPSSHLNPPAVQLTRIDSHDITDERTYKTGKAYVLIDWRGGDLETDSSHLQYQYKLHGQWSEPVKQNTATIGLENGEHQFELRAIDHHFNTSSVDSITIIVKTEAPYLFIGNPDNGDIVSGELYVKGQIRDDDFAAFQVFISDLTQTNVPILEDDDDKNIQKPYRLIIEASARPRTETLAKLRTKLLDDGDYQVWLTAQDQLEHSSFAKILISVDNTPPTVKILTPKVNERVLKQVVLSATASDIHLDSYRLDYTTDLADNDWDQIYVKGDLYQEDESGLLKPPELQQVEIQQEWEVPIKEGQVWIRLLATDIAGNTSNQTIQVEVPVAVVTRKGGTISPDDQQAELYFPPNTLAQDTIVTVNALTETEVEPPVRRVGQVYDFAPITLRLNSIKPATLTLSYDPSQFSAGKEPVIFHRTDGAWKAVGGTPNREQQTISAAVLSLGQYTLGEMDKIEALDSANLKPDSLTCQPRVFSPMGNSFSTHTTISFTLDQPASVSIKVYNVAGKLVEWIAQQQTFGSGKQAIRWSGRDSDGEIVATGLYIVTVTVGDQRQDKVVNVWNH